MKSGVSPGSGDGTVGSVGGVPGSSDSNKSVGSPSTITLSVDGLPSTKLSPITIIGALIIKSPLLSGVNHTCIPFIKSSSVISSGYVMFS